MAKSNVSFSQEITSFVNKTNTKLTLVKRLSIYNLFAMVVDRTPKWVDGHPHTGTAKWNWKVSIGSLRNSVFSGRDPEGSKTKDRGYNELQAVDDKDEDVYIENSVPYIFKLEEGGYPDPSMAKNPRTVGGFSTQAPEGIARVSALEWNMDVEDAVREVKT